MRSDIPSNRPASSCVNRRSRHPSYASSNLIFRISRSKCARLNVTLLHKHIIDSLAAPEMKAEFAKNGVEMIGSTPAEFADFVRREMVRWTKIARDNNIRAE